MAGSVDSLVDEERDQTINVAHVVPFDKESAATHLLLAWSRESMMVDEMAIRLVVAFNTKCRSADISPRSSADPRGSLMLMRILLDKGTARSRRKSEGRTGRREWKGHTFLLLTLTELPFTVTKAAERSSPGGPIRASDAHTTAVNRWGAGTFHGNYARGSNSQQLSAHHLPPRLKKPKVSNRADAPRDQARLRSFEKRPNHGPAACINPLFAFIRLGISIKNLRSRNLLTSMAQ